MQAGTPSTLGLQVASSKITLEHFPKNEPNFQEKLLKNILISRRL